MVELTHHERETTVISCGCVEEVSPGCIDMDVDEDAINDIIIDNISFSTECIEFYYKGVLIHEEYVTDGELESEVDYDEFYDDIINIEMGV
jgi:hypothetical protein